MTTNSPAETAKLIAGKRHAGFLNRTILQSRDRRIKLRRSATACFARWHKRKDMIEKDQAIFKALILWYDAWVAFDGTT